MPSIEIVCVDQERPIQLSDVPFAVESGASLVSHRRPSLFQADFDRLKGCIYHLGNPALKNPTAPGAFFAWDLLSPECQAQGEELFLQFADKYTAGIRLVMEKLLQSSPQGRLIFTSDHQFGPPTPARFTETSLEAFWTLHNARKLRMNALYPITG
ncbi:MAG: hypothetical protein HYY16_04090 [Planctomycetes bacterium]|nr:hypothetical protein [Planctomycetota bacterium]